MKVGPMGSQLTVLLAEDEVDDVFLMQRAVAKMRLPVRMTVVRDGEEALDYLQGETRYADRAAFPLPDLLLLDLKMPRKSGFQVMEWLQGREEFAELMVVILTSSEVGADIERARELGATGYLVKTVRLDELRRLFCEPKEFLAEEHWPPVEVRARY